MPSARRHCAQGTMLSGRRKEFFCLQCAGVSFAACWSFVSSVLEFCLQCAGVLFAACNSFVCSVSEFCLQRVILLLVVCMYFLQFLFCLQCAGDDFFDVLFLFARNLFICSVFSFSPEAKTPKLGFRTMIGSEKV